MPFASAAAAVEWWKRKEWKRLRGVVGRGRRWTASTYFFVWNDPFFVCFSIFV